MSGKLHNPDCFLKYLSNYVAWKVELIAMHAKARFFSILLFFSRKTRVGMSEGKREDDNGNDGGCTIDNNWHPLLTIHKSLFLFFFKLAF